MQYWTCQGFREQVGKIHLPRGMENSDASLFLLYADELMADIDVLRPAMVLRVVRNSFGSEIVHLQGKGEV